MNFSHYEDLISCILRINYFLMCSIFLKFGHLFDILAQICTSLCRFTVVGVYFGCRRRYTVGVFWAGHIFLGL